MAKRQTRRTISFSKVAYDAATVLAVRIGISVSELATRALRSYGAPIPETHHAAPAAAIAAEKARQTRARRSGPRAAVKRLLPARRKTTRHKPVALRAVPSRADLEQLLAECDRRVRPLNGSRGELALVESRKRKVSLLFAAELRKRGWLSEEGYAPGSWADPKNATREAS